MTVVEYIVEKIIELRDYKKIKEEKTEWGMEVIAESKMGYNVLIWGLDKAKVVGVKWVREMSERMKELVDEGLKVKIGIIIGGNKTTKSAEAEAIEKRISMITKEFPINLMDHVLVPKHEIMSKEEVKKLINKYGILPEQLPWIRSTDPVVKAIGARPGDVIRIRRKSDTAGESIYYRYVVP